MQEKVRAICWIVWSLLLHTAYGQSQAAVPPTDAGLLTPKKSAERLMKDPEVVPITDRWLRDNPGKLVVALDAACNGMDTYHIEFNASKEALFRTRTIMWLEVEPTKEEPTVPLLAVETTHTTSSPAKKVRFSVGVPRTKRDVEVVVEIKELRTFTIDGQTSLDGQLVADINFANGREPDLFRVHLRVKDFGFDAAGNVKFIGDAPAR